MLMRYLLPLAALILVLMSPSAVSADLHRIGNSVHQLMIANHLLKTFYGSECGRFVDMADINRLVDVNNRSIADLELNLNLADRDQLRQLASSPRELALLSKLANTYFFDSLHAMESKPGGKAFGCGYAYANVLSQVGRLRQTLH